MNIHARVCRGGQNACLRQVGAIGGFLCMVAGGVFFADMDALAQSVRGGASSGQSLAGGVAPQFKFGGGTLYIDNQGTQGFLYTPGQNFESYSFRNPTTGQAWSGAVMTFGPQLSIGLIQGANQIGTATVLPGPPRQTSPLPPIESTLFDDIDPLP
ncbi:MAG: hypothetical protein OEY60_12155 [Nitrospira sp.]|nr:hypothetical protein [Nitrospira sp.]MDH5499352.1 hypothetical protein [Nitrospira sp.]MDH5726213.1 hypothetical protein [Nitrospira sp.]